MTRSSYRAQKKRFWRDMGRLGLVFLAVGAVIVALGVDMTWHSTLATGLVAVAPGGSLARSRPQNQLSVYITPQVVNYTVDGRTFAMSYAGGQVGDEVTLRYYDRWPRLAWTAPRAARPLFWGAGVAALGLAGVAMARRSGRG